MNFAKCDYAFVRIGGNGTYPFYNQKHMAYGCFENFEQTGVFHSMWVDIRGWGIVETGVMGVYVVGSQSMFSPSNSTSERPVTGDAEIITLLQQQELSGKVQVTYRTDKLGDSNAAECGGELKIHQIEYTTDSCRYGGQSIKNVEGDGIWVSNVCDATTNRNYFGAWHGSNCSGDLLSHLSKELHDCSNRAWYLNDDSKCDDDSNCDDFDDKQESPAYKYVFWVRHGDDDYDDYRIGTL